MDLPVTIQVFMLDYDTVAVRAVTDIESGAEITIDYGRKICTS